MKLLELRYKIKVGERSKNLKVDLSDAFIILLRGNNPDVSLHVLEDLLGQDFTGNSYTLDRQYGEILENNVVEAELFSEETKISGKDSVITVEGKPPHIHCVKTLNNNKIRSFMHSKSLGTNPLHTSTDEMSHVMPESYWVRVCETVNQLIDRRVVDIKDNKFVFDFIEYNGWGIEAQKAAYMLISECLLTPDNCKRIVLITNNKLWTPRQVLDLAKQIRGMRNHGLVIITAGVTQQDLKATDRVEIRSVR